MHGLPADLQNVCDLLPAPARFPRVGHLNLFESVGEGAQGAYRAEPAVRVVIGGQPGQIVGGLAINGVRLRGVVTGIVVHDCQVILTTTVVSIIADDQISGSFPTTNIVPQDECPNPRCPAPMSVP